MNNSTYHGNTSKTKYQRRASIWALLFTLLPLLFGINLLWGQAPAISYAGPQTYLIGQAITALVPTNTGGSVPANGYSLVTTLAGSGYAGGANGTGYNVTFDDPSGVAVDATGNVYVADQLSHMIRKISPTGVVTTLAGNGYSGHADGTGAAATFNNPTGVALDAAGNVYVADQLNNMIRKISPAGVVTTLAGSGAQGYVDGTGTVATFYGPAGVALDAAGNVYVADQNNNLIRIISPAGVVTTLAGSGAGGHADGTGKAATFYGPSSVALDASGNVYVADYWNNLIRKISPVGVVTTLAGSGAQGHTDGTGTAATFYGPRGVAVDAIGNVYVGDAGNMLIRKISPAGVVTTFAGHVLIGGITGGNGTAAFFNAPSGVALDATGNLYVADYFNNMIRTISVVGYAISPALPSGLVFDSTTGTIRGTAWAGSPATVYTISAFNLSGGSTATLTITIAGPPSISYTGPKSYTPGKAITALVPTNTGGAIPATNYGQPTVLAGSGTPSYADGTGTAASFNYVSGVAADGLGNLYVTDFSNNRIRKIVIATGVVTTFAGSGRQASTDGSGTAASFSKPVRIVIGGGNIYVSESGSNKIRQIVISTAVVTTLAGTGNTGFINGTGTAASFSSPSGLALDGVGNLYVADITNNAIRKIIISTGVVSTYASSGAGGLNGVADIAMDIAGNLYVDNYYGSQVRVVAPSGTVSILAGSGNDGHADGTGTNASFTRSLGLALDNAGNIFLVQQFDEMVRRVAIGTGAVSTIAAYGQPASTGYSNPQGIAVDGQGNIYVANANRHNIISVPVTGYSISPALPAGLVFDATNGTISGTPTATQAAINYTISGYNTSGSSTTILSLAVTAPGGVSGAALWIRADDGASTVGGSAKTAWGNQSGTTNLSGTGTFNNNLANLANFNPVITFNGFSNSYSASNLLANGITGNDNFIVVRGTSYSVASCAFVYGNSLSTNRISSQLTWSDGLVYWDFASNNTGNGRTTSTPVALNTYGLYGFHNGNTIANGHFIALNGTITGSSTISPALTFNGTNDAGFSMGNNGNSGNYFQGNIPEMITFPTALTTTQRQQVESYLGVKYGETLPYNYLASDGTTTTYNVDIYPNNIAGIGRDDITVLNQKQSQSLNTTAKGNMITMAITTIATSNALNTNTFTADRSFNIWGDDGGSVTTATALPSPGFSGCAQRLTRLWKVQRTGSGTGGVKVTVDLNNTISLTGFVAADIQLVIDTDGDGNLATGTLTTIKATTLISGVATFNNISWDSDGSGTDVFAIVTNKASNSPVAAIISTVTATSAYLGCTDASGYLQFVDNASVPTIKFMTINPNGNTAYDFTTVAPIVSNNSPIITHQMKTDASQNSTALANRMWTVTDNGVGSYTINGGMTVRLYYDPADTLAAKNALDSRVTSTVASSWFKFEGTGHATNVAAILTAQTTKTITGATLLTPNAIGTESNGTNYVEFTGIKNFSTFGYMAARNSTVLPITLASFTATEINCTANLAWQTTTESNSNHYEVETATDGITFVTTAEVTSKNSATGATYSYADKNLTDGINYFRLKAVDNDGKYTYSQTVTVQASCATGSHITAFPNPAHNLLNVKGLIKGNHIMLLDIDGKKMTSLTASGIDMAIDISSFAKGVYTLRVETANGNVNTLKVMKQ